MTQEEQLAIQEKARRYDEAIEKLRSLHDNYDTVSTLIDIKEELESIFPELAESEDERIRKELIDYFSASHATDTFRGIPWDRVVAWLEKQSKNNMGISEATKKKLEDNLNKALEKETPESWNKFLDEQGEQNLANYAKTCKVEPKFHEGDIIKPKDGSHEPWQIMQVDVLDKKYRFKDGYVIHFSHEDNYKLVEQTPTWSEEDEKKRNLLIAILNVNHPNGCFKVNPIDTTDMEAMSKDELVSWLKSLKDRYTWKPSDEQMLAINTAINVLGKGTLNGKYLIELQEQLKKLMEE